MTAFAISTIVIISAMFIGFVLILAGGLWICNIEAKGKGYDYYDEPRRKMENRALKISVTCACLWVVALFAGVCTIEGMFPKVADEIPGANWYVISAKKDEIEEKHFETLKNDTEQVTRIWEIKVN